MIGDSGVGKTSIINSVMGNQFNPNEVATIGAMFVLHSEEHNGCRFEFQVWDTAGQEKFRSLGPIYYRNADAAIAVFSMTDEDSLRNLDSWIDAFTYSTGKTPVVIVVGNKSDLIDDRRVDSEQARAWASEHHHPFIMTSAKTGDGIGELFVKLAELIYNAQQPRQQTVLTLPVENTRKNGCNC